MIQSTMQANRAMTRTFSQVSRGTRLMHALVRSLVQRCVRTTGRSRHFAAARTAAVRTAAVRAGAAHAAVQAAVRAVTPPPTVARPDRSSSQTARHAATASAKGRNEGMRGITAVRTPESEPAFARVSSRRNALAPSLNPVRIYSTPSRTVMVGNMSEVARLLDLSIEREQARLVPQI
jgi:hypothetical protein